jgi:glycosyltransferase involved in cell wall biosynthesis
MSVKPKVINIITRLNVGGVTTHVVNLSYGLQHDFDTILISGQKEEYEDDMTYYAEKHNIPVVLLKNMSREISLFSDITTIWELYRLFRKEKPSIVHTHTSKAGTVGRIAAFLSRVPFIYHTFHGNFFYGYFSKFKTKIFIYIERFLALLTTNIIAISEKQKQDLIDFKISKPSNIKVIKLGIDFHHIMPQSDDYGKFKNEYSIPDTASIVSIISRLSPIKNHSLFIEIAHLLKDENIYFLIVGGGECKEMIEDEIKHKDLTKIIMTGQIYDLKPVYADSDFVLITSINEGTPVALIEAMANGKIVMSTNVGGVSDFIVNGVNGFYFEEKNPVVFAEKILDIINKKIDKNTIAENARDTAISTFSVERLVKDISELYKKENNEI